MRPPLLELGGSGPVLHLAVANGFPPATYEPLFARLRERFRIVCIPPRALWVGMGPPPAEAGSWESLADDLVAGWEGHGLSPLVALGHSFGAVASLLAAVRSPGSVSALVMLDPTIMPREIMAGYAAELAAGRTPRLRLVDVALKRRSRFTSPEEAFEYWRGKDLFRDWPDPALDLYARAMLQPDPMGEWSLVWPPEWEAWYYRSFYPHTWDIVPQLDPAIPVLVVRGQTSDTFVERSEAELRKLMPGATFAMVPDAGHLFPQSHSAETRAVLEPWLASIVRQPRLSVS